MTELPVKQYKSTGRTAKIQSRIIDAGVPYHYLGLLPVEDADAEHPSTLPYSTRLYTIQQGKPFACDGQYCTEDASSVAMMLRLAQQIPQPTVLYARPTRRHSWTKINLD